MYVSHVSEKDGSQEAVADHLREVAEMAADLARPFGAEKMAYMTGIAHDIGKYSKEFQNRILRNGPPFDHSTAGAYELFRSLRMSVPAFCIAGHHGGLPDGGSPADDQDCGTLQGRMLRAKDHSIPDYKAFSDEIVIPAVESFGFSNTTLLDNFSLAFYTRMLFSCLVDADFLCTERFMAGQEREILTGDSLAVLLKKLEKRFSRFTRL